MLATRHPSGRTGAAIISRSCLWGPCEVDDADPNRFHDVSGAPPAGPERLLASSRAAVLRELSESLSLLETNSHSEVPRQRLGLHQANPSQANPGQANPSQPKPTEANPTQTRPSQAKPSQANPSQANPTQAKPSQPKPTQANPISQ